jgi:hypothetical protein
MSDRDRLVHERGEHERAIQRLDAAEQEQGRARDERERARGAPQETGADVSLRVAEDQVSARRRWLEAVDEHNY